MVTHDPEEAMSICDKVAVMSEGKIHQIDTPINLLNNPKTIFVSSFILGNNILPLNRKGKTYSSCLGKINSNNFIPNKNIEFMSISPKFISIIKSKDGSGIVIAKEFLGEYFIYKVYINGEKLRIRTNINITFNIGDRCSLGIEKGSFYFIYPGGEKIHL